MDKETATVELMKFDAERMYIYNALCDCLDVPHETLVKYVYFTSDRNGPFYVYSDTAHIEKHIDCLIHDLKVYV